MFFILDGTVFEVELDIRISFYVRLFDFQPVLFQLEFRSSMFGIQQGQSS
jgi:hypothetical protein